MTGLLAISLLTHSIGGTAEASAYRVAFGDSNTAGTTLAAAGYPLSLQWTIKTASFNAGVGGNTTAHAIKRFEHDVLYQNPKEAILMFGTNDAVLLDDGEPKVSKKQFEENISYMVRQLKERNVKVVLMTSVPVIQTFFYERNDKELYNDKGGVRLWQNSYNEIVRRIAVKENVQLIDNYKNAIYKAGNATDGALNKSGLIDRTGTHWSPRGAEMIAYSVNYVLH